MVTYNMARTFLRSIRARHSSSDVVGLLTSSASNVHITDVTLAELLNIATQGSEPADPEIFRHVVGMCLDVQRYVIVSRPRRKAPDWLIMLRAKRAVKGASAGRLVELVQDLCSMSTCISLFADHEEDDDSFDLGIWKSYHSCSSIN
jgi:hypothetical protein